MPKECTCKFRLDEPRGPRDDFTITMNNSKLTKCPYTLKLHADLPETSREHVILDALGGPTGYSVITCRKANSQFGESLDAAFLREPVVEALRSRMGIESRSGVASWNLRGQTVDEKRPVDLTIPHEGAATVFHRKPVERDAEGKNFRIVAPSVQADKILQEMKTNLAKKGLKISEAKVTQSPSQEIHTQMIVNLTVMSSGLMKIAYLACCEFLGDGFLDDPLNSEWQKAIRATTADDAERIRIHGCCFNKGTDAANRILPRLAEHERGIVIVNLNQGGPVVAVRLFGSELLTAVAQASETNGYGLPEGDGLLLVCDAKTGVIRREQWANHLLRMSQQSQRVARAPIEP